jgi:hypothetical protein
MSVAHMAGAGAARDETRILLSGMSEILAHEFFDTVRRLGSAWLFSHYLDRIRPLELKELPGRTEIAGKNDLRAAAPGITFLTTCRDLFGQDRVLKLFESLARRSLDDSIASVFRMPAAELEKQWLAQIRKFQPAEITISAEEAPTLAQVRFVPESVRPGSNLGMRVFAHDGFYDLTPSGIFVVDESSGRVFQGRKAGAAEGSFIEFEIPIDPARPDGKYTARVIAADEAGNVRMWETSYSVGRLQVP